MSEQQTDTQAVPEAPPKGTEADPQTGRLPFGFNPATPVGPGGTGGENPANSD